MGTSFDHPTRRPSDPRRQPPPHPVACTSSLSGPGHRRPRRQGLPGGAAGFWPSPGPGPSCLTPSSTLSGWKKALASLREGHDRNQNCYFYLKPWVDPVYVQESPASPVRSPLRSIRSPVAPAPAGALPVALRQLLAGLRQRHRGRPPLPRLLAALPAALAGPGLAART